METRRDCKSHLEKAARKHLEKVCNSRLVPIMNCEDVKNAFMEGAKWYQERSEKRKANKSKDNKK